MSWPFLLIRPVAREVGRVIQSRDQIHPATYVGTGKIMEIKDLLWETEASGIICDDETVAGSDEESPG